MSKPPPTNDQFPRKFGKYHLLAPLAQGGMGALYLAVTGDKGFERLLCIKTVLPHLADDEYVARFRDEAKIVVQLSHGNLIPVFDAGQVDGELFLAMEFIKGKDLRAVWNRCAKKSVAFPVDVAVYLTKELCRGLGYAHSAGSINLVHRDVSPPNVLLSYAGEVKLTDFGLASSTLKLEKTAPGIIYGKVAYMSPEQARGDALDGRSDIYAAGIILWELLTGRQLFPPGKEQPQDLLKRARNPEVMPPSKKAPRVPRELDALVLKALAANPDDRYASADEFKDALGAWLSLNHPSCDIDRVEAFVGELFDDDIVREEEERLALVNTTRERIKTMPPTDELRLLLEKARPTIQAQLQEASDRRKQREGGKNLGRRAPDQGQSAMDRRGQLGRRSVDGIRHTQARIAVDVPKPSADGVTVISTAMTEAATAVKEPPPSSGKSTLIGRVLEGRYLVEQLIGEGGMGRVYLAEHVDIGKKVAVKVLHQVYGRMPDLVERFRREARAASRIGHPNIVDVTDSGTTADGSVYFVMEYLQGIELAGVIDREGAIDIRRALDISTQVCRALSAAHAVGIIHRDLKPENVFLTSREGTSDFVKVLDFGIAKSSEAEEARSKKLTSPGMAMGTPEYMAPEQAAGKPADERCDVYALGAILYEMLTGKAPYSGDNFMEILTSKATSEPAPPRSLRPEIPLEVEELLLRAMARRPDDRPPSMEAFEYELTKCFAGRGTAVANILRIAPEDSFEVSTSGGAELIAPRMQTVEPQRISEMPVATPPPPADPVLPTATPAPSARVATPVPLPDDTEEIVEVPDVRGGGLRAMGWFFFIALLISAGAAVFYVAKGEADAPRPQEPEESVTNNAAENAVVQPREEVNTALAHDAAAQPAVFLDAGVSDSSSAESEVETNAEPEQPEVPVAPKNGNGKGKSNKAKAKAKPKAKGPAKNKKEARAILKEAKQAWASGDLAEAKRLYQRVASSRHLTKDGYLGLSEVAFQNKNSDDAIRFARKAGGSIEAKMALGHGFFQQGKHKAALSAFEQVLERKPKHKGALKSARAAREAMKQK
jgi:serine/threonine-protein kinase